MTNSSSPEDRRLSKFSNADRGRYNLQAVTPVETTPDEQPDPPDVVLSDLIEHVIRDGIEAGPEQELLGQQSVGQQSPGHDSLALETQDESRPLRSYSNIDLRSLHSPAAQPENTGLPPKLLEELHAAREQVLLSPVEPAAEIPRGRQSLDHELGSFLKPPQAASPLLQAAKSTAISAARMNAARERLRATSTKLMRAASWTGRKAWRGAVTTARGGAKAARTMRPQDWHRRYFNSVTFLHRRLFDARIERLLFIKTAPPSTAFMGAAVQPVATSFHFQGPVPRLVLDWCFSALPSDLKRFAFVDFRAAHGRTLLLAARRNFEYAAGYAFDQKSCEQLEMNLSQYPRSYMACRDVRAIRGDLEGVVIPAQPVVLYFPAAIREAHLSIIMSYVSSSYRLNRRPVYLVLENVEPGHKIEYDDIFKRLSLPVLTRLKAGLLSPVRMAVYVSAETAAQ